MSFTGTPAAERCERAVLNRFAGLVDKVGQYHRRYISGTATWSQHSWGNGLDIHVSSKRNGDVIYAWLRENRDALGIRVLLWWVSQHYDHIHVDFWPKGVATPPLSSTGKGWFQYPSGQETYAQIQVVPAHGDFPLEDDDVKELTMFIQEALIEAGFDPGPVDGIPGPKTKAALVAALTPQSIEIETVEVVRMVGVS